MADLQSVLEEIEGCDHAEVVWKNVESDHAEVIWKKAVYEGDDLVEFEIEGALIESGQSQHDSHDE